MWTNPLFGQVGRSGLWKSRLFGAQMSLASLVAITGSKKSRFPGPNPLPLALIMDLHASRTLRVWGRINHRSINSYYFAEAGVFGASFITVDGILTTAGILRLRW